MNLYTNCKNMGEARSNFVSQVFLVPALPVRYAELGQGEETEVDDGPQKWQEGWVYQNYQEGEFEAKFQGEWRYQSSDGAILRWWKIQNVQLMW